MKKIALFALAALCTAAAQAVTINWTVKNPTYNGTSGDQWVGVVVISGTLDNYSNNALGITYTITGNTGTLWTSNEQATGAGTLQQIAAADATAKTPISGSILVDPSYITGDTFTVIFVPPYQYANLKQDAYSLYTFNKGDYDLSAESINIAFDAINLSTGADHQATLEAVPEPTALALLALGVAGLALKRKNA